MLQDTFSLLQFDDFSNFKPHRNDKEITSQNLNETLTFELSNTIENQTFQSAKDNYLLLFDENGSCTDFSFSIRFIGNFDDFFGSFSIILGSYISNTGIKTVFSIDLQSSTITGFDVSFVTATRSRYTSLTICQINKGDSIVLLLNRNSGIASISIFSSQQNYYLALEEINDLNINYIILETYLHSEVEFSISLSQVSISLFVDNEPSIYHPFSSIPDDSSEWYVILRYILPPIFIFGIIIFAILYYRKYYIKLPKEQILLDPAITNYKEPLSEDFLQTAIPQELSQQITEKIDAHVEEMLSKDIIVFDGKKGPITCAICRSEIKPNDEVLQCPNCKYYFHKIHYIKWVSAKNRCPICKNEVVKKK